MSLDSYEAGDVVTATAFNKAARALFNLGLKVAGPPVAAAAPNGCNACNFSSYTTVLRYPINIRNHWITGKRDRDYLRFWFSQVYYNTGAARTGYAKWVTTISSHSAAATSFTIAGTSETVKMEEIEIQKDDKDADFQWLEYQIYQSSIVPPSITTWSHFAAPLTTNYNH